MIKKILLSLFLIAFIAMPVFALAQDRGLIPCNGVTTPPAAGVTGPGPTDHACTWVDFVQLISNVLNFLILLSIPLAAIAFAWSGVLMLTAAGNESQVSQAKGIFTKVLIGFLFVLTAWLIVHLITGALLNSNYTNLLPG